MGGKTTPKNNNNEENEDECNGDPLSCVAEAQLNALDDADPYASVWAETLRAAAITSSNNDGAPNVSWGGRGRGGRALARRTWQPHDVLLDNMDLEFAGHTNVGAGSRTLLRNATIKLSAGSGRVYALVGRNGSGKTTLLRRMDSKRIPGFPVHLTTCHVPQEVVVTPTSASAVSSPPKEEEPSGNKESKHGTTATFGKDDWTPIQTVLHHRRLMSRRKVESNESLVKELEATLDALDLSGNPDENVEKKEDSNETNTTAATTMEETCERISTLQEDIDILLEEARRDDDDQLRHLASTALCRFGVSESLHDKPLNQLSGGMRKRIALASAVAASSSSFAHGADVASSWEGPDILMLDEPTNHLDVAGIVHLRQFINSCRESQRTTILLVSHDIDLLNDVATDVIHLDDVHQQLNYYPGNYRSFCIQKRNAEMGQLRQSEALERRRGELIKALDNAKQATPGKRRGGASDRKKQKQVESRKKKLERHGLEKNEKGHRWKATKSSTGFRVGAIGGIDAAARTKLSHSQLLLHPGVSTHPVPDKAVQFHFRNTTCTWNEPLIMAMDVGHGFGDKKDTLLFDCVDLSIDEGSRTCILGESSSGKSTLLQVLSRQSAPKEGRVISAHGATVEYFHQHMADELLGVMADSSKEDNKQTKSLTTPLSLLTKEYPQKSQQDLRGELTNFGLDPDRAVTNVSFLSGGERCRLCLAYIMLRNPDVLLLDEPTNHLDAESVEALIYGLEQWNGAVILVSHDANLIRSIGGSCYVLIDPPASVAATTGTKKLMRLPGGIDSYLRTFALA